MTYVPHIGEHVWVRIESGYLSAKVLAPRSVVPGLGNTWACKLAGQIYRVSEQAIVPLEAGPGVITVWETNEMLADVLKRPPPF